jgi:hypothetical protein
MALSRRLLVSGARKKPTTGSRTSFRFGLRSKKRCAHHPDKSTNGPVPSRRCASVSILQQALRIPLDHGKLGRLIEFSGRPPQEVDSSQHEDQQRGDRDATYSEKKFEQPIHNSTTETAKLRFPMNRSDSPKPVPRPYLIPARPARLLWLTRMGQAGVAHAIVQSRLAGGMSRAFCRALDRLRVCALGYRAVMVVRTGPAFAVGPTAGCTPDD